MNRSARHVVVRVAVAVVGALGLLIAPSSKAGDWTARPARKFHLRIAGKGYRLTEADRRWARSLVAGLRSNGGLVESFELAPSYPSAELKVTGAPADYRVFRQAGTSRYLVVSVAATHRDSFLVDFVRGEVIEFGGIWTTTVHPHPSGRFAVIVYTHRSVFYGVPVGGPRDDPRFSEGEAWWY